MHAGAADHGAGGQAGAGRGHPCALYTPLQPKFLFLQSYPLHPLYLILSYHYLSMNYYNEFDRKTAAWLRELIKTGAIPDGHVDERSIADVQPSDLRGYTQCHFFAGIGGWSYALQLAGWPADRPVWTGSCPCQPFSSAGKGLGTADERHLWPVFFELIRQCRPKHVFGEQVASAIGHGWLDGISADLEAESYACGATVLGAHSVGAPHIRQRLYWVANNISQGGKRFEQGANTCITRQWHWSGKEDMQSLVSSPFAGNDRWPQPLLRSMDDGLSARVVRLRGYGNAIVPQVAAEFVAAFMDVTE